MNTTETKQTQTTVEWKWKASYIGRDWSLIHGDCFVARFSNLLPTTTRQYVVDALNSYDALVEACKLAASKCTLCKGTGKYMQHRPLAKKVQMDCPICEPYRSALAKGATICPLREDYGSKVAMRIFKQLTDVRSPEEISNALRTAPVERKV